MQRNHVSSFWRTATLSAAVAAMVVLVFFRAGPTNAGRRPLPHAAVAQDVAVDGTLTREGGGWIVNIKATNSGALAQRCDLGTQVTSVRNSMMSRVPAIPTVVWQSTVALTVPAGGQAEQTLRVPEEVAQTITAAKAKTKKSEFDVTEVFDVSIEANCGKPAEPVVAQAAGNQG